MLVHRMVKGVKDSKILAKIDAYWAKRDEDVMKQKVRDGEDFLIGNYKEYKIVFNGGFVRAQEDGFTKIEIRSSMGAGGYSQADVKKMMELIDTRRAGDSKTKDAAEGYPDIYKGFYIDYNKNLNRYEGRGEISYVAPSWNELKKLIDGYWVEKDKKELEKKKTANKFKMAKDKVYFVNATVEQNGQKKKLNKPMNANSDEEAKESFKKFILAQFPSTKILEMTIDSKTKDGEDQLIANYEGYKIVFNGGFVRAQEDGFTKFEVRSSMGAGGYSQADVKKIMGLIDARRTRDSKTEDKSPRWRIKDDKMFRLRSAVKKMKDIAIERIQELSDSNIINLIRQFQKAKISTNQSKEFRELLAEASRRDLNTWKIGDAKTNDAVMECMECGKKFRKKLSPNVFEVKCPYCGGYDVDVISADSKTTKDRMPHPRFRIKDDKLFRLRSILKKTKDEVNAKKKKYLVVNNEFNQAHYKDLIGKKFDSPPAYAQVKEVEDIYTKGSADKKSKDKYIGDPLTKKGQKIMSAMKDGVGGLYNNFQEWQQAAKQRGYTVRQSVHPSGSGIQYNAKTSEGNERGAFDPVTNKGTLDSKMKDSTQYTISWIEDGGKESITLSSQELLKYEPNNPREAAKKYLSSKHPEGKLLNITGDSKTKDGADLYCPNCREKIGKMSEVEGNAKAGGCRSGEQIKLGCPTCGKGFTHVCKYNTISNTKLNTKQPTTREEAIRQLKEMVKDICNCV